ncbi:MAG: copper homeostasis protein CutC [Sphingobacteriales bacterium]|nr:copper homeostasis protein CutC [Sphingobacteriales bacterium]
MISLEICANSVTSALIAQQGGANRVELCENLAEGGTTPSYAQIEIARKLLKIELFPILRPRGGDFVYSDLEFEIMKADLTIIKELGCDGVVFGILDQDGNVDKHRCAELLKLAQPLQVTFHRAFDKSANLFQALEDIIALGFSRILTSGGKPTVIEGIETITKLVSAAKGRISIMPGSGVNENNLDELIIETGATEFHTTAKSVIQNASTDSEYCRELTDLKKVKNLADIIERHS